jgi:DNA-binding transcriptional MocR family regulator
VERVLTAWLRPGDAVAVEDPGFANVLDLLAALGLRALPVVLDADGMVPADLRRALEEGARAVVVTPRAQNPTGAALDEARARALAVVLDRHADVGVVEDDHAGPVAGSPVHTTVSARRHRWAVVRSVSKWLGPDLRLAVLAADPTTLSRVRDRQALGPGWVSHVMQGLVASVWADREVARTVRRAERAYATRRRTLVGALARHGVAAQGRTGLNVWVPVASEHAALLSASAAGFAVAAGERFRLQSGPAVRVTVAALDPARAPAVAAALADVPTRRSA